MENQTFLLEFALLGLSDFTYSRIPLVSAFFLTYLSTLAGNLLIIYLVSTDSHLKTPMYVFLGNLSVLDIFTPSIPASHLPLDIFPGKKTIVYSTCVVQVFFFGLWFTCTEILLLAVMSYDRYAAICHPLHYTTMISISLCIKLAASAWIFGFLYSLMHTLCALRLSFCDAITIQGLFCELYQLIQLSCSDTFLNNLILNICAMYGIIVIFITLLSYVYIFKAILRIKTEDSKLKAYSTCSSHLTVVFFFYGTGSLNYYLPNTKQNLVGRLISVIYTLFIPFLNPLVYSLRNNELKSALSRSLVRVGIKLRAATR